VCRRVYSFTSAGISYPTSPVMAAPQAVPPQVWAVGESYCKLVAPSTSPTTDKPVMSKAVNSRQRSLIGYLATAHSKGILFRRYNHILNLRFADELGDFIGAAALEGDDFEAGERHGDLIIGQRELELNMCARLMGMYAMAQFHGLWPDWDSGKITKRAVSGGFQEGNRMEGKHEHHHRHEHEHVHAHTHEHSHDGDRHTHEHSHAHSHEHEHDHSHEHSHVADSHTHEHAHEGEHGPHDHSHQPEELKTHNHTH